MTRSEKVKEKKTARQIVIWMYCTYIHTCVCTYDLQALKLQCFERITFKASCLQSN